MRILCPYTKQLEHIIYLSFSDGVSGICMCGTYRTARRVWSLFWPLSSSCLRLSIFCSRFASSSWTFSISARVFATSERTAAITWPIQRSTCDSSRCLDKASFLTRFSSTSLPRRSNNVAPSLVSALARWRAFRSSANCNMWRVYVTHTHTYIVNVNYTCSLWRNEVMYSNGNFELRKIFTFDETA